MPTRREFLSSATLTLLALPIAECSSHKDKQGSASAADGGLEDALPPWPDASVEAAAPPEAGADAMAADASSDAEAGACNGASDTSTAVPDPQAMEMLHTHTVCVPAGDLSQPPAGSNTYTTSTTLGHTHTVTISADELQNLGAMMVVTVTSSTVLDHEHVFIFNT